LLQCRLKQLLKKEERKEISSFKELGVPSAVLETSPEAWTSFMNAQEEFMKKRLLF
jgi:hypothetical protein